MNAVKLKEKRPNYLERPTIHPDADMKRAREQVRADRKRRARYLMTESAR